MHVFSSLYIFGSFSLHSFCLVTICWLQLEELKDLLTMKETDVGEYEVRCYDTYWHHVILVGGAGEDGVWIT